MPDSLSLFAWREPLWLWLALYPWLAWIWHGFIYRPRGRNYAEPQLLPWALASRTHGRKPRSRWRYVAFALAWLLFAMAMAGPRLVDADYSRNTSADTELMVVLDVSRSMTARDVAPNRMERARLELENLISRSDHARIGLVVYAARPHLIMPPTEDKSVLLHGLQIPHSGLLPTEGSDLGAAITFAARSFQQRKGARVLLLVTDGEIANDSIEAEADLQAEVTRLAKEGIIFYALGVGSKEGNPLIGASGDWLRNRDAPVVSRLHETRLQQIARDGKGLYAKVSDSDAEWRVLYDHGIRQLYLAHAEGQSPALIKWKELQAWFLVPAVLLLFLSNLHLRGKSLPSHAGQVGIIFIATGLASPLKVHAAEDGGWQQRAYQAYISASYQKARQAYARVAGYQGRMGEGCSAYRQEKYTLAVQMFTQAVLDADSDQQRARAIFNLANSYYQREDYERAVALYGEVLRYDPDNSSAPNNRKLALAMLEQQQEGSNESTQRQGRGPRSARLLDGETVVDGKLSLDREPESPDSLENAQPESLIPSAQMAQGMLYTRPADRQATRFEDSNWHYENTSAAAIILQVDTLEMDENRLWKRLFEREENFPAPVDTPRTLPGIPPW
ncbi:vWA domain-containing protein [Thiolapillus sp.]